MATAITSQKTRSILTLAVFIASLAIQRAFLKYKPSRDYMRHKTEDARFSL